MASAVSTPNHLGPLDRGTPFAAGGTVASLPKPHPVRRYEGAFPSQPVAPAMPSAAPTPVNFSTHTSPASNDDSYLSPQTGERTVPATPVQLPAAVMAPPTSSSRRGSAQHHHQQPPQHHSVVPPHRPQSKLQPPSGRLVYVRQPSRPDVVLAVPAEHIHHVPRGIDASRLFLCPYFDTVHVANAICPQGAACGHVHADISRAAVCAMAHESRPEWRCLADVHYTRGEPGAALPVTLPNARNAPPQMVPRECLLATRALESTRRPLAHCVHFYSKGICHRGAQCCFAHAVFLPATPPMSGLPAPEAAYVEQRPSVRRHDPYRLQGSAPVSPLIDGAHPAAPATPTETISAAAPRSPPGGRGYQHSPYSAKPRAE